MACCLTVRRSIAACFVACLLTGWSACAFADTANVPPPSPIYQLPKSPGAIDDMMQKPGGTVDDVPPPPSEGG